MPPIDPHTHHMAGASCSGPEATAAGVGEITGPAAAAIMQHQGALEHGTTAEVVQEHHSHHIPPSNTDTITAAMPPIDPHTHHMAGASCSGPEATAAGVGEITGPAAAAIMQHQGALEHGTTAEVVQEHHSHHIPPSNTDTITAAMPPIDPHAHHMAGASSSGPEATAADMAATMAAAGDMAAAADAHQLAANIAAIPAGNASVHVSSTEENDVHNSAESTPAEADMSGNVSQGTAELHFHV
eukprot:CAMPEP_0113538736 /NCGR_PEP_ID=MMETSP0015_2-20120614/7528_1 /TAXON_ID=2838 /ORGANISM="Odontella" /LENGTH=241 /DNA_ID=CAMNT_0000438337 /DNA_START=57 /DNA_END=782 /DNA_ORIENTATION=- /assembly_acc=CAM_ASM_000160